MNLRFFTSWSNFRLVRLVRFCFSRNIQVILFAITLYNPFAFGNVSEQESDGHFATYYKENYEDSRAQFRKQVMNLKQYSNLQVTAFIFASTSAGDLTTDVAWIRSSKKNTNLKVIVSGIHGIEGYVGSAVQTWMMDKKVLFDPNFDYLFVHALNPYGFKNNRRVDENNVDLNRNFVTDQKLFTSKNSAYEQINYFLNPEVPVELGFFGRYKFIFSAVHLIMQNSLETLRHAILSGQYEFPTGIYFGGSKAQYQTEIMNNLHQNIMAKYKSVFVIDLHTGYGQKNKLHLLVNSHKQASAPALIQIFSKDRIDFGDTKNFYQVNGDLLSFLENKSNSQCRIKGITFEFGTFDSQTTLGSIESLRRLILENQLYQFKASNIQSADKTKRLFRELFYPADSEFRKKTLEQAEAELNKITEL